MHNFIKLLRKNKMKSIILGILFIITIFSTIYIIRALLLLRGIETFIRILFSITIILIAFILSLNFIKSLHKKKSRYGFYIPFVGIYCAILLLFGYYIYKTYNAIDKMTTSDTTYSSSLISLKGNSAENLTSLNDGIIGMVDDKTNVIGYQIPKEIIEDEKIKNQIEEYESYVDLLNALYSEEIEYAFLPTNYAVMFETMEEADFKTIREDTKIIYTKDRIVKNEDVSSGTDLTKPFTILLMGVDSEYEAISGSSFNGDSLILITFNPNTLSSTILSIPRDSYVPIMCFAGQKKNKITHAAWYGEDCMMDTIENFTGIPIDYFVKINFKGVVKLVDTLGGVEVDVPYAFCEQDSNRKFGNNTIYVEQGLQVLNGEQALAFSRNRHPWPEYCPAKYSNYVSNDFIRGQNQQVVIRSLLNKFKGINSLDTVYDLLDTIGESMQTNMTTSEILSLYNIAKDILVKSSGEEMDELLSIQRLYLSGYDKYIYDSATKLNLYNYILYQGSISDVAEAMKINLELAEPTLIKTFNFSIDEPFEEEVIGMGTYTASSGDVDSELPDFTGDSETQARFTARRIGVPVSFKYQQKKGGNNTVISQNYPEGTKLSSISTLVLTIATPLDEVNEEDDEKETKTLPDFTGDTETQARATAKKLGIPVSFKYEKTKDGKNTVILQNYKVGTKLSDISTLVLTIAIPSETVESEPKEETPKEETPNEEKPKEETPKEENTETKPESGSNSSESTTSQTKPKEESISPEKKEDTSTNDGDTLEIDDKIGEE